MSDILNHEYSVTSDFQKLSKDLEKLIGKPPRFEFDITLPDWSAGSMLRHPDLESPEPVVQGKIQLQIDYWRVNPGKIFSPVLESPDWKTLLVATNNLLEKNQAGGIFLEALRPAGKQNGILQIQLEFGS